MIRADASAVRAVGVDSIQRGVVTTASDVPDLVADYFRWLARRVPLLSIDDDGCVATFRALGVAILVLRRAAIAPDQVVLEVTGGALTRGGGTFTFAREGEVLTTALTGYRTRLPRALYMATQYRLHALVMQAFLRRHGPR